MKYNKWITLFFGFLGVHRYMAGEIGMGIIYTFTCGLFGIGWFVDIIRSFMGPSAKLYKPLQKLPVLTPNGILLQDGEICHYQGSAYTEKKKERVAGYTSDYGGGSVRIAKGLSLHTGSGRKKAVRETVSEKSYGLLYVTSRRIVYLAEKNAFDKEIHNMTAYNLCNGGVIFQFGSTTYSVMTEESRKIRDIIDGILNGMEIE